MKVLSLILLTAGLDLATAQIPIVGVQGIAAQWKVANTAEEDDLKAYYQKMGDTMNTEIASLFTDMANQLKEDYKERGSEFYADGQTAIAYTDSEAPALRDERGADNIPAGFGDPFIQKSSIKGSGMVDLSDNIKFEIAEQGVTSNVVDGDITEDEDDPETYTSLGDVDCTDPCDCLVALGGGVLVEKCKKACKSKDDLSEILTCAQLEAKGRKALTFKESLILDEEEGTGIGLVVKTKHPLSPNMGAWNTNKALEEGTFRVGSGRLR